MNFTDGPPPRWNEEGPFPFALLFLKAFFVPTRLRALAEASPALEFIVSFVLGCCAAEISSRCRHCWPYCL